MRIVNLTKWPVTILGHETIPASGQQAFVPTYTESCGSLDGMSVIEVLYKDAVNLPAPEEGVAYIVARVVAEMYPDRGDLYYPSGKITDASGNVVGYRALGVVR